MITPGIFDRHVVVAASKRALSRDKRWRAMQCDGRSDICSIQHTLCHAGSPLCGHFLRQPRARSSLIPIPRLLRLRPPWPKTPHVYTTPCLLSSSAAASVLPSRTTASQRPVAFHHRHRQPPLRAVLAVLRRRHHHHPRRSILAPRCGPDLDQAWRSRSSVTTRAPHHRQPTTTRRDRTSDRNAIARHSLA